MPLPCQECSTFSMWVMGQRVILYQKLQKENQDSDFRISQLLDHKYLGLLGDNYRWSTVADPGFAGREAHITNVG